MRRSLAIAFLILLTAGVMAMGAPLDDARKSAASADKKLLASGAEIQAIAKRLLQHLAALADIARQIDQQRDRQQQLAPLITQALNAANAELLAAKADVTAAATALRNAEASAKAAHDAVGPKRAAVERAAGDERKAFEGSSEFQMASTKAKNADDKLAETHHALDDLMRLNGKYLDGKYGPLFTAADKAEADLAAARAKTPPDDAEVAELSAKWINAENQLAAAKAVVYAGDPKCVDAQQRAAEAAAERSALLATFDKLILKEPGVAEAQLALRDANNDAKLADAAVANARDDLARAGQWLVARRTDTAAITQIAHDTDAGLAGASADLKRAQDVARGIGQDLVDAATHVLAIRDDVKATTDAINAATKTK